MNTPEERGKPFVETVRRVTREVRMVMTGAQVIEALSTYVTRNFREFRGMKLEFELVDEMDYEFEVIAVDEKEERDEGIKSGGASTTGAKTSPSDSTTRDTTETESV